MVGFYEVAAGSSAKSLPLIEQHTGGGWRIVTSPSPAGASGALLYAVTCAGAGCWAAGSSTDANGDTQTLIEEEMGGGWSVVPSPTPAGATNVGLDGVTCTGGGGWAVGSYTASRVFQPLIEQDLSGGWAIVPGAASTSGELFGGPASPPSTAGPSAAPPSPGGASPALIEHDTGSGWKAVTSPSPAHSTESELSGVACVGASDCWVAGFSTGANGNSQALIAHDTGSGWAIVSIPAPSGSAADDLNGVTCAGPGECWAVGSTTRPAAARQR